MNSTDFFELPLDGFDELHQNNLATNMYAQEMNQDKPMEFAPNHYQKILDRTEIRTARKCYKSGSFTLKSERFIAEFEVVMTIPAFKSLFDSGFYTPEQFGFESSSDMWDFYHNYFESLVYVHKIIEVQQHGA